MATPVRLAQLSDPHIQVGRRDLESAAGLTAAVREVLSLPQRPQAVIVTGDLVDVPRAREYERVRELLAPLPMPVFVLGGNHDDRDAIREYFALDGSTGPVGADFRYTADLGELRLVVCDTTIVGSDAGNFDTERRTWLEKALAEDRETPTLVAMHHPPIDIGIQALDIIGLPPQDRILLGDLIALSPQVKRVIAGHVHRGSFGVLGGCGVFTCPSTYLQAPLEIPGDEDLRLIREDSAIAVHALLGDDLVTHLQPIED